jgi:ABC-type transport system substrate-binding protein
VLRKTLAIPAAVVVLLSGATGIGRPAASARITQAGFAGTISISDYQVPNALGAGNLGSSVVNQQLVALVSDGPLSFDQHGDFFADLATQVPSTANGGLKVVGGDEIITYHLKPNQRWSDGSPVTRADYIIGFLLTFAPDVSTVDPYNRIRTATFSGNDLILHLKGVYGAALQQFNTLLTPSPAAYYEKKYGATLPASMLQSWDYAREIDPKTGLIPQGIYASSGLKKMALAWLQDHYTSPADVFNGPFKVQTWSPDQRYVLTANPYYTALPPDKNHPRPQTIQFVVLSEDQPTFLEDLKADATYANIDKVEDFDPNQVPDLRQTRYQLVIQPALDYEFLNLMVGKIYNGKPNPLADVRVRQALNYAIDKNAYARYLFGQALGTTEAQMLALGSFIPASSGWADKSIPQNDYNPAKARALLKAAGYATTPGNGANNLTLDFVTTTKTSRIKGAALLQRFFNQVGINIRIRFVEAHGTDGLFSTWQDGGIEARHTFQVSLHGVEINPDPDEAYLNWAPDQISSASNPNGANSMLISDPKLDALFAQGRDTLDDAGRHRIYNQAQEYFYQQAYNVSLFTNPTIVAVKGTVGNFKPNPTQTGQEWNGFEWWFDRTNSQKPILD